MRGLLVLAVGCVLLAGCAGLAPEGDTTPEQPSDGGPTAPHDDKQSPDETDTTTEKPGDPGSESTSDSEQSPAESANVTADEGSYDDTAKLALPQNRSDPANGTLGWYDGYWYDDPVAVNTSDGLNGTEREAVIARTMARVEVIRGLPFEESVDIEVISREQFRDRQSGGDRSSDTTGTKTLEAVRYEALFLVGDDGDAGKQRETNRGETVGGFYSTTSGDIVLVSAGDTPRVDSQTLAHELTHALQDQQFDLTGTLATDTHDRSQAQLALIEGDANYVMYAYDDRCGEFWTCLEYPTSGGSGGDQPDIHMGLYLDSFFPYSDGPAFVDALRDGGDWEPVNLAYDDPPETTREIITPAEYGTFEPSHVTLEERSTGQWTQVRRTSGQTSEVVGRAGLSVMFAYTIYHSENTSTLVSPAAFLNVVDGDVDRFDPLDYDLELTRGWVGDRLRAYERGNETAYVWKIAWESPDDARRFLSGYRQLLQYREGERVTDSVWALPQSSPFSGSIRVTAEEETVTIVNAPTRESLSAVHDTGS